MLIIKFIILLLIFVSSGYIGILVSKKYTQRVVDLKEIKKALNIFSAKIKFTYEPIPVIFKEISEKVNKNIGQIFLLSSSLMEQKSAGDAWKEALDNLNYNLEKEDIETLKGLSSLLRKS